MNTKFNTIMGFLLVLFLFSGCATYKESTSLLGAFNSQRKVKITTIDRVEIEYQKIDTIKGRYVGEKLLSNNKLVYEPINPKSISKVQLHRSKQAERTEGLTVLGIIFLPALALLGLVVAL